MQEPRAECDLMYDVWLWVNLSLSSALFGITGNESGLDEV